MEPERTESLLAELPWLQALARELARDPDAAADAVQDACVVALRHGGAVAQHRAWLATVLRNCLLLRRRRTSRGERREAAAAAGAATVAEPVAELVQRAELQQHLGAVVLGLPAHQRDVVLLRFFDGLPPRAIARRLGVPVATVHSRLQRALQQLRRVLDGDQGGRRTWAAVALSLPVAPSWPLTVLGVQTKWKVAVAALVAAGSMTWWWNRDEPDSVGVAQAAPSGRTVARGDRGGGGSSGGAMPGIGGQRTAAQLPAEPVDVAAGPELVPVRGRVCACDGTAMAGVPVSPRGSAAAAVRSDSTGAFTIELPSLPTSLVVEDDRFVTVLGARWTPDSRVEPVLVVAPALRVGGMCVDQRGTPVAGAHVMVELPEDFDARFPVPLDRGERLRWIARGSAEGRFDLGRVPAIAGARLLAAADALRPTTVPLPPADDANVQIVLLPFAWEQGQLGGIVVDPRGVPVAGARVAMGVTSVVSDQDGRFALLLRRAGWPTAIVAAKQGYLPGRFELPRGGGARREDWPDEVVLRLGSSPLSIHGRVVDQEDRPIANAAVWVDDPTLLGIAGVLPVQVEYVLGGGELPRQAARMQVPMADEPTREDMFMDQTSSRLVSTACWFFVRTDEGGKFELPGLLPRDYRIRAFDQTTGVTGEAGPVPAGGRTDLRIVRQGLWPVVRGRVVSLRGEPMAGVEVSCNLGIYTTRERVPGGHFEGRMMPEVGHARTGADGSFSLEQVDQERAVLSFGSDAILPMSVRAVDIADPKALVVEVEARCHVEVVLQDANEADEVLALDGAGEQLDIAILRSGSNQAFTELALHEGRSGVFVLGERAAALVLRKDGAPVRRVPLQLDPGRTFRVQ